MYRLAPQTAIQPGTIMTKQIDSNPLLADWTGPFGVPPFDKLAPEQLRE